MATRAVQVPQNALIRGYACSGTVTAGAPVKLTADNTIANCSAGEASIGIAMRDGSTSTDIVDVLMPFTGIVKAKVASGGTATRNTYAKASTAGVTNAGTLGGGSTLVNVVGMFLQSGTAGDDVSLGVVSFAAVSA